MSNIKIINSRTNLNTVLVKIIKNDKWQEGLQFYTNDEEFVQVATWNYNKGKLLKAHSHKEYDRASNLTQEVLFIKNGSVKLFLYDIDEILIAEEILYSGDIAIIFKGGHGYEILEDSTQVLEIKNGPYPGLDLDKKLIE